MKQNIMDQARERIKLLEGKATPSEASREPEIAQMREELIEAKNANKTLEEKNWECFKRRSEDSVLLATERSARAEAVKALIDLIEYLKDTDELGEEYFTPPAKACYDYARSVIYKLASLNGAKESEK